MDEESNKFDEFEEALLKHQKKMENMYYVFL